MRDPARTAFGAAHVRMPSDDRAPANGPVIVSQLSPEELERYRAMDRPKEKQPIKLTKREEGRVVAKMTKEQYLQAVAEGKTDAQIAAEVGYTPGTLSYYRSKWQLTRTFTAKPEEIIPKIIPFDFAVYENMRERGMPQPKIAEYFGVELEYLKARVAAERGVRAPAAPQTAIITIEQHAEPLNDVDKTNVPPTVENAADVTADIAESIGDGELSVQKSGRIEIAGIGDSIMSTKTGDVVTVIDTDRLGVRIKFENGKTAFWGHFSYSVVERVRQEIAKQETDGEQYVSVRIPVRVGTPLADIVDLKRSEAFGAAYHMLEQVIAWAAEDMEELLGTADVDKLQAYVDRQIYL